MRCIISGYCAGNRGLFQPSIWLDKSQNLLLDARYFQWWQDSLHDVRWRIQKDSFSPCAPGTDSDSGPSWEDFQGVPCYHGWIARTKRTNRDVWFVWKWTQRHSRPTYIQRKSKHLLSEFETGRQRMLWFLPVCYSYQENCFKRYTYFDKTMISSKITKIQFSWNLDWKIELQSKLITAWFELSMLLLKAPKTYLEKFEIWPDFVFFSASWYGTWYNVWQSLLDRFHDKFHPLHPCEFKFSR